MSKIKDHIEDMRASEECVFFTIPTTMRLIWQTKNAKKMRQLQFRMSIEENERKKVKMLIMFNDLRDLNHKITDSLL